MNVSTHTYTDRVKEERHTYTHTGMHASDQRKTSILHGSAPQSATTISLHHKKNKNDRMDQWDGRARGSHSMRQRRIAQHSTYMYCYALEG